MFIIVTEDEKIAISYLGNRSFDICVQSSPSIKIWRTEKDAYRSLNRLKKMSPMGSRIMKVKEK